MSKTTTRHPPQIQKRKRERPPAPAPQNETPQLLPGSTPFDLAKALHYRIDKGYALPHIAQIMGITWSTFYRSIKPFLSLMEEPERSKAFVKYKPVLMSHIQSLLVEQMTSPDKLSKASLNNLAYAFSQLDNSYRLETGKPTSNINVNNLTPSEIKVIRQFSADSISEEIDRQWAEHADEYNQAMDVPEEEIIRAQQEAQQEAETQASGGPPGEYTSEPDHVMDITPSDQPVTDPATGPSDHHGDQAGERGHPKASGEPVPGPIGHTTAHTTAATGHDRDQAKATTTTTGQANLNPTETVGNDDMPLLNYCDSSVRKRNW